MNLPTKYSVDQSSQKKTQKTSDFSSTSSTSRRDLHQIPGDFLRKPHLLAAAMPLAIRAVGTADLAWSLMPGSVPWGQCSVRNPVISSDLWVNIPKNMWNSWKKKTETSRWKKMIDKMVGFFHIDVKKIKELTMKLLVECLFLSEDVHLHLDGQHSSLSDLILVFPC